ncbi:hypothetical protein WISP_136932 [Willisornis vidua]|uniref:Uncharacterized protein n=1 Tax=Willisornis vidua TaxID=1566151 RepID=A0ABQ9CU69_9PASS|nr:hypothetical protein WISP_136932 [Willisornis vidua]
MGCRAPTFPLEVCKCDDSKLLVMISRMRDRWPSMVGQLKERVFLDQKGEKRPSMGSAAGRVFMWLKGQRGMGRSLYQWDCSRRPGKVQKKKAEVGIRHMTVLCRFQFQRMEVAWADMDPEAPGDATSLRVSTVHDCKDPKQDDVTASYNNSENGDKKCYSLRKCVGE